MSLCVIFQKYLVHLNLRSYAQQLCFIAWKWTFKRSENIFLPTSKCFRFLVAQQLNTYFCVCVCCMLYVVCSQFLIWNVSLFEYLKYSRIFKEREISYQKLRTDKKQTNTQMLEIKDMSYTYKGHLSTDKDDRKLGNMLIIPFPVWAGIRINSSPSRKGNWN